MTITAPPAYRLWLRLCAVWLVTSLAAVLLVCRIDPAAADIRACAVYALVAAACLAAFPAIVMFAISLATRLIEIVEGRLAGGDQNLTRTPLS